MDNINTHSTVAALSALAHETRLNVFRLLVQAGPEGHSAGYISQELNVVQNTMSAHLNILKQAGLVLHERQGRSIKYRANYATMSELISFLLHDCCQGNKEVSDIVTQRTHCN